MELKLKQITGYLPYGIMAETTSINAGLGGSMCQDIIVTANFDSHIIGFLNEGNRHISDVKPILYPYTALTKKMGKYCVLELTTSISAQEEDDFELYGKIPIYWQSLIKQVKCGDVKYLDYQFIQTLYEHHFDFNNLIEKGLAINKLELT